MSISNYPWCLKERLRKTRIGFVFSFFLFKLLKANFNLQIIISVLSTDLLITVFKCMVQPTKCI